MALLAAYGLALFGVSQARRGAVLGLPAWLQVVGRLTRRLEGKRPFTSLPYTERAWVYIRSAPKVYLIVLVL